MRVLIFDTETNGLPSSYNASYTDVECWPRILQIAWQVWDIEAGVCLQRVNALIKPDPTMIWNEDAAKIHGHQYSVCVKEGRPFKQVLDWLIGDSREVDLIVAHNLSFDKRVLGAECQRLYNKGGEKYCLERWWPTHELCSMMQTVKLCKIPSKSERFKNEFKWPKLLELHQYLFPQQSSPSNLHDADGDVACLVQCFRELVRRNVLPLPALNATDRPGDRFVKLFREVLFMIA